METKKDNSSGRHFDLAEIEAYRTGELEKPLPSDTLNDPAFRKTLRDLELISETFLKTKPGPEDIPETADRAVLAGIGKRASDIRGERKIIRLFPKPLMAAAAAILVCICLWPFFSTGPRLPKFVSKEPLSTSAPAPQAKSGDGELRKSLVAESGPDSVSPDIDGDGSINIVDAYLLAKRIEAGRDMPGAWDVNGDGFINAGDVRELARTAVLLGTEET